MFQSRLKSINQCVFRTENNVKRSVRPKKIATRGKSGLWHHLCRATAKLASMVNQGEPSTKVAENMQKTPQRWAGTAKETSHHVFVWISSLNFLDQFMVFAEMNSKIVKPRGLKRLSGRQSQTIWKDGWRSPLVPRQDLWGCGWQTLGDFWIK